jgi:hypothetical protein
MRKCSKNLRQISGQGLKNAQFMEKNDKMVEMTGGNGVLLLHQIRVAKLLDFLDFIDRFAIRSGDHSWNFTRHFDDLNRNSESISEATKPT